MRDYGRVHTKFWTSDTIRTMSEDGRVLAFYLLTSPHSNIAGVFRLPDGYVCDDIQWSNERVIKGFEELLANGFATRCQATKWVVIHKHLEWNPPENPNQRKSALKIIESIPDECTWKIDFIENLSGAFEVKQKQLPNRSKTLSQSGTGTGTGIKDIRRQPKADSCPHQEIIALYADALPELPQPRIWDGQREKNLTARWRWVLADLKEKGKPCEQSDGLDFFKRMFEYIHASDFLMGRAGTWSADLGWIVKAENFAKIIQGNYENKVAA